MIRKLNQSGLTLTELLLAMLVIGMAAVVVIRISNPKDRLARDRNAQRQADITAIANAIHEYAKDNQGKLPQQISETSAEICASHTESCKNLVDISAVVSSGNYIQRLPTDPQCSLVCAVNGTGYKISKDSSDHLILIAPYAEKGQTVRLRK